MDVLCLSPGGLTVDALIDAAVTLLAAAIGVLLLFWQIGRQARNAIAQGRHQFEIQIKKDIYDQFCELSDQSIQLEADFSWYLQGFAFRLQTEQSFIELGQVPKIPDFRWTEAQRRQDAFHAHNNKLLGFIEKWSIVEPRLDLFRLALFHQRQRISDKFTAILRRYSIAGPVDVKDQDGNVHVHWRRPESEDIEKLQHDISDFYSECVTYGAYMSDFMRELQVLLLGDVFPGRPARRKPLDPTCIVLDLSDYDRLNAHFLRETGQKAD